MSNINDSSQSQAIEDEIAELERRLEDAKARLNFVPVKETSSSSPAKILRGNGKHRNYLLQDLSDIVQDLSMPHLITSSSFLQTRPSL